MHRHIYRYYVDASLHVYRAGKAVLKIKSDIFVAMTETNITVSYKTKSKQKTPNMSDHK